MVFSGDKENFWQILKTNKGEAIRDRGAQLYFCPSNFAQ